jgi:formylglycine-generating enzyme required for sulfatase activity
MKNKLFLAYVLRLLVLITLPLCTANAGLLPQDGEAQYELEFWQSIQNSTDAGDYEAYLEAYPDGKFAPLARTRAARYKKDKAPEKRPAAIAVTDMDIWYKVVTDANVRRAPSSQADKLDVLRRGDRVHVTGQVTGEPWYRIQLADKVTGYVYADLLRKPAAAKPAPAPEPPAKPRSTSPPPAPVVRTPAPAATTATTATVKPETVRDCPDCPELVVLPPGSFTMGDPKGDRSEKPAHKVTIKQPFAIGKYEVTAAQWNNCVEAGGCKHKTSLTGNTPVRDISWSDAREYVRWLTKLSGKPYRLPTEAEWEYAARAGTDTRYWWGDNLGVGKANCRNCGGDWSKEHPADVDGFPANPFGLYGTSGGVWEWVADCWYSTHSGAPRDGSSRDKSDCREYVIRGGAWRNDSTYVHAASRFKYDAYVRYLLNGFRVARSVR